MSMRLKVLSSGQRVSVVRVTTATLASGVPLQSRATQYSSVNVLLEPLKPGVKDTPLGSMSQAKWRMSWCAEVLKHGDQITVISGPTSAVGGVYILREIEDNTQEIRIDPYAVGYLFQGDQS